MRKKGLKFYYFVSIIIHVAIVFFIYHANKLDIDNKKENIPKNFSKIKAVVVDSKTKAVFDALKAKNSEEDKKRKILEEKIAKQRDLAMERIKQIEEEKKQVQQALNKKIEERKQQEQRKIQEEKRRSEEAKRIAKEKQKAKEQEEYRKKKEALEKKIKEEQRKIEEKKDANIKKDKDENTSKKDDISSILEEDEVDLGDEILYETLGPSKVDGKDSQVQSYIERIKNDIQSKFNIDPWVKGTCVVNIKIKKTGHIESFAIIKGDKSVCTSARSTLEHFQNNNISLPAPPTRAVYEAIRTSVIIFKLDK